MTNLELNTARTYGLSAPCGVIMGSDSQMTDDLHSPGLKVSTLGKAATRPEKLGMSGDGEGGDGDGNGDGDGDGDGDVAMVHTL